MDLVKIKLKEMGMEYVSAVVEEGGVKVDQLFFHDPDGYMIEICNCDNLPVLPLSPCLSSQLTWIPATVSLNLDVLQAKKKSLSQCTFRCGTKLSLRLCLVMGEKLMCGFKDSSLLLICFFPLRIYIVAVYRSFFITSSF